jgi:hypothetical protein
LAIAARISSGPYNFNMWLDSGGAVQVGLVRFGG